VARCSAASALFITSTCQWLGLYSAAEPVRVPLVRRLYPTSIYFLHGQTALTCPSCSKTSVPRPPTRTHAPATARMICEKPRFTRLFISVGKAVDF
jgi:hypothetical protein